MTLDPLDYSQPYKRKLRILIFYANQGGCSYYRALSPYAKLQELYPNYVECRFTDNPIGINKETMQFTPDFDYEELKWCDILMINNISNFGGPATARALGLAKEFGKFICMDTDDLLTELYDEHKLAGVYKEQQLSELTKHLYYNSDLVTVTQFKFADRVKPFCSKFLAVIKNAIDYDLPAWNQPKRPSKVVRVGWAGGIHHLPDVKHFATVPHIVNQKVGKENVKWNFYGHPPPNPDGSKDWQFDTWRHYMDNFFRGFKGHKNYEIFYALPPSDYGVYFSDMDIAIAPLEMNPFNDSKCFGAGEKVILFDGSLKNVEDIKVGDKLLGPDSLPRNVLSTTSGIDTLLTIDPHRGKKFKVTKDHILALKTNDATTLKSQPQFIEKSCVDYLALPKNKRYNYRLYKVGVEFPNNNILPLDPYFVGIMLGDGSMYGTPAITTMDPEIKDYFTNYCLTNFEGLKIQVDRKFNNKAITYHATKIVRNNHIRNPLMDKINEIGLEDVVCGDKFIPQMYKVSSRQDRLSILAGLIDTDGSLGANKTFYTFTNKSKQLVDDTAYIARSLGLYVSPTKSFNVFSICDTTYYRIQISGNVNIVPCLLPRKRGNKRRCNRDPLTSGFKILEGVFPEPYYGFKVDGDGLFLLDDFTVTHNSDIKIAECGRYKIPFVGQDVGCYSDVIKNGYNGYLIPPDAPKSEWVRALTKLIKDKDLRLQMGENLHKQTEELFNLKKVVRRRLDIYNECFKTMGKDPRDEN